MIRLVVASFLVACVAVASLGCAGQPVAPDLAAEAPTPQEAPATPPGPVLGPEPSPDDYAQSDGIKIATFLGDAHRRTYGRGPVPERLDLVWKARIGSGQTGGPGGTLVTWSGTGWTGQPTVVRESGRDYLLIGGYDHNLRRIDAETGETVWTYTFPDVIKGTNTVFAPPDARGPADYIVVAGSRRGLGLAMGDSRIAPLRAVTFASGEELWRLPVPRTRSYSQDADASALPLHGRLYVAVESGYVYALEPTATAEWEGGFRRPQVIAQSPALYTEQDAVRHGGNLVLESSPCVLGTTLYIAAGSGHVYGLDLEDLSIVWDFYIGSDLDGTVVATTDGHLLVAVEKQYIPGSGGVYKLDPRKPPAEAVVWYYPTEDRGVSEWLGGVIGSVAVNDASDPERRRPPLAAFNSVDGYLYVVSQDLVDGVTAGPNLEPDLPRPVLVHRHYIGAAISTPLIVDDTIVVAGYDGKVRLLSIVARPAEEGAAGSEEASGGQGEGVLLRGRDGEWYMVSVEERASFAGGGSFESTPIVWNGRVYIGSRDGYLYCLGVVE